MTTEFAERNGEDIPFTFVQKSSIDIYDVSILTPTSKLVYKQWKMDSNDELLIDGYFRESNVTKVHLPFDIKKTIASYYVKRHSKSKLKELYETQKIRLTERRKQRRQRRQQRKQNCINLLETFCFAILKLLIGLLLLDYVFGADIAGLIIFFKNDCNVAIDPDMIFYEIRGIDVDTFLCVGCFVHLIFASMVLCWIFYNWFHFYLYQEELSEVSLGVIGCVWCLLGVFTFIWCVIGFILHGDMDKSTMSNKQCSDIVIAWSSINFINIFLSCIVIMDKKRSR